MEWIQVLSLFLANAGLILWFRAESRSDWKKCDEKIDANHRETYALIDSIRHEIKDFHVRLCSLEEKYLKDRK